MASPSARPCLLKASRAIKSPLKSSQSTVLSLIILSFSNHHYLSTTVLVFKSFPSDSSISIPLFFLWLCSPVESSIEMEEMKRWQIPAFGNWEYCDDMPINHYCDYGHAGLIPTSFYGEEDLFKVPVAMPVKHAYPYDDHCRVKARKVGRVGEKKQNKKVQEQRKQERVCNATAATPSRRTAPMAVDEDLYKIPPELLYPKLKRKKVLRNLLSGCMGVVCIR